MSETTQFVSRISVKDLISAFETKSETVRVEFSRPRARSYGNVLNKNVVVRLNEYLTLEDIEKGLTKLETDLNFYEVYNKAKHVAFQEQFFNILTSVANIENNDENAPTRKKRLISRTQTLVSFLNQKLPTNINQVVDSKPSNQYKYTTYASHVKASSTKSETDGGKPVETQQNANPKVEPTLYVENNSTIDITDSGGEYIVSVKKLKENFQNKTETDGAAKEEKVVKVNQTVTVTKSVETTKQEVKQTKEQPVEAVVTKKLEEDGKAVSVTKLRSLFEERSSSKGLEVITVDKPQLATTNWGGSVQNITNIPYTERNLGSIRLQRSVSGNYMNYSGLLKRVDINRSSSVLELNPDNKRIVIENTSDEESEVDSDNTEENDRGSLTIEEISSTPLDNRKSIELNVRRGHVLHITRDFENGQIEKSFSTDREESDVKATDNLLNGRGTFTSDDHSLEADKEKTSSQQGSDEEEVFYSQASLGRVDRDKADISAEESIIQGVEEVEVNSGVANSKNVVEEENIATLEAVEDVSASEGSKEVDSNKTTENELSFKGYDEEEVNQGTASSENVQIEENVAKLEARAQDVSQSVSITEVETNDLNHDGLADNGSESDESQATQETDDQVVRDNEDNHSLFSSLHELEDERERSLIDEVIENIDIEQTLANADLVVNPEDLKNADDEFEKLLENSQNGK